MTSLLHEKLKPVESDVSWDDSFSESDVEIPFEFDSEQAYRDYFLSKLHFRSIRATEIARSSAIRSPMEMDVSRIFVPKSHIDRWSAAQRS